jgi:hypothetical protein
VDPHATEVVAQEIVERVAGEEAETIRNPVRLVGGLVEVGFGTFPQVADGLGSLLVRSRPDAKGDTIQGLLRVLLEDERVMDAMRLASTSADLDIVGETSLRIKIRIALPQ